jgi:hypothetical protein
MLGTINSFSQVGRIQKQKKLNLNIIVGTIHIWGTWVPLDTGRQIAPAPAAPVCAALATIRVE